MAIFVKNTFSDITFYLCEYSTSKCQNQEIDVWVVGHLVTQFQGQVLRAAANNRVCGHASGCGYAPTSPIYAQRNEHNNATQFMVDIKDLDSKNAKKDASSLQAYRSYYL